MLLPMSYMKPVHLNLQIGLKTGWHCADFQLPKRNSDLFVFIFYSSVTENLYMS